MRKTTRDIAKSPTRRPRPKGTGEPVLVRLQPGLAGSLDAWRRKQDDLPTRAAAIRRLVEQALSNNNAEGARRMIERAMKDERK
jgi:hypothetical protein